MKLIDEIDAIRKRAEKYPKTGMPFQGEALEVKLERNIILIVKIKKRRI